MCTFESFSEDLIPRVVPEPILLPIQNNAKPIVPEVSLILDHSKQKKIFEPDPSKPLSYKEWKRQQASGNGLVDNQNPLIFDNAQKKNVTFANENNKVNEKHNGNKPVSTNIPYIPIQSHDLDLSLCDQMAASNCRKLPVVNNRTTNSMAREQQTLQSKNPNLFKNPVNHILQQQANNANKLHSEQHFELEDAYRMLQLYHNNHGRPEINTTENLSPATTVKTANPAPPTKEITMTDLYQLMLKTLEVQNQNTQTNVQPDIVENISQPNQVYQSDEPKCSGCKQIVPKTAATNAIINDNGTVSTPEPTLKDLFQIILKQQEHLMNITKQLQCIVLMNNSPNPAIQPTYSNHNAFVTSNPATGVMTSLEINVQKCNNRPMSNEQDHTSNNIPNQMKYLNNYQNQEKHCCCDCKSPVHPKTFEAYEISDTSNDSSNADQEQVDHNEMQKENNYAFYGNILNQVNDVLKHSPPNITRNRQQIVQHQQPQMQSPQCPQSQKQQTPQYAAQDATQFNSFLNSNIRTANFRQIGFQFDDVNISATSKRVTFDSNPMGYSNKRYQKNLNIHPLSNNEQSMLMNALAMKYLPNNGAYQKQTSPLPISSPINDAHQIHHVVSSPQLNSTNNLNIKKSTSDTSLANYRYLEKYGLL